jgi:hypothetical protein
VLEPEVVVEPAREMLLYAELPLPADALGSRSALVAARFGRPLEVALAPVFVEGHSLLD